MTDPLFSVEGQIVVVSGGSRGIGYAIAQGFVERGATVIVTGRDQQLVKKAVTVMNESAARTGLSHADVCDVSRSSDIAQFVARTLTEHGHIDTLINVAGVNRRKPAVDVTEDDYDFVMDINLKGAFLLSQFIGRHMVERNRGSQINISSLNNDRPLRNVTPYAMSKAGLGQMTRALALEWGPSGVRVNGIAPGFILTDLTRTLWADSSMQQWGIANTPQRRLGQPSDLVGAAIFLASPASAFVTGQILYVDGGFTCGWSWPIPENLLR
jgi:NAD(P)-dependent dehydrogenase (short-subunit alcohol dehydrogenase family)